MKTTSLGYSTRAELPCGEDTIFRMLHECEDKFELHRFWKSLGGQLFPIIPVVVTDSKASPAALCSFLLALQHLLQSIRDSPIELPSNSPEILTLACRLPPYGMVWLLDCERLLRERVAHYQSQISLYISTILALQIPPAYRYKITSAILRIAAIEDFSILKPVLARILSETSVARLLVSYVSELPQSRSVRDSLGLVVLSEEPFIRIFLMRALIYLTDCLFINPELFLDLSVDPKFACWQPWQVSIGLLALFNDHEGLIVKILIKVLDLELKWPFLFADYPQVFSSNQLYCDLLYRSDMNVDYFINATQSNTRLLSYLYRLYSSNVQGLLFSGGLLKDQKLLEFHRALHAALNSQGYPRALITQLNALIAITTD